MNYIFLFRTSLGTSGKSGSVALNDALRFLMNLLDNIWLHKFSICETEYYAISSVFVFSIRQEGYESDIWRCKPAVMIILLIWVANGIEANRREYKFRRIIILVIHKTRSTGWVYIFGSISLNVTGNLRNETDFNYNKLYICPIAQALCDRKINSRLSRPFQLCRTEKKWIGSQMVIKLNTFIFSWFLCVHFYEMKISMEKGAIITLGEVGRKRGEKRKCNESLIGEKKGQRNIIVVSLFDNQ